MRKFLCYDTNDAASGKINVNSNGMLNPKATIPSGGTPYQQLVTDEEGNAKWEDKPFYEGPTWEDFTLSMDGTEIEGFMLPDVGGTVLVKINGIESVETVKSVEFEDGTLPYVGNMDPLSTTTDEEGWYVIQNTLTACVGFANPQTTLSLKLNRIHRIDDKFINQDGIVRTISYYARKAEPPYKKFYKANGDEVALHKCDSIILPNGYTLLLVREDTVGIGLTGSVMPNAFIVDYYEVNGSVKKHVFGTDEAQMEYLANNHGYTLTTKPTT